MVSARGAGIALPPRSWRRAPVEELTAAFAPRGEFGRLTTAARLLGADVHLWSDLRAEVHRARIWLADRRLLDIAWEPSRAALHPHRDLRTAQPLLPWDRWLPTSACAEQIAEVVQALRSARRTLDERRGAPPLLAAAGVQLLTQEYAPFFIDARVRRATLRELAGDVVSALDPAPVPGSGLILSYTPDALAVASDGTLAVMRRYRPRAPEVRFAAAQAVLDIRLLRDIVERGGQAQRHDLDVVRHARMRLGFGSLPALRFGDIRTVVGLDAGTSPRLRQQAEAVAEALRSNGIDLTAVDVVETPSP
ncbi:MAG: hypothetical protein QM626_06600 [Microbacterium sp.]|uniref:hypothetical protein n=1 Tax=Microbacterium sp. TaxID=51671 RepID=UPI0039E43025